MITPADVLFAWDAQNGIKATVGGEPSFSRGGEKWVRGRAGGGALYTKRVGDQVPLGWVERDGVLAPRRTLEAESAETPENDDSVQFDSASAWFRTVGSEGAEAGLFDPMPSGASARAIRPDGTGGLWQSVGSFTGDSESLSAIFEYVPSSVWNRNPMESIRLAFYDETAAAFHSRATYNIASGTTSVNNGTPEAVVLEKLADSGPNGGTVWRCILTDTGVAGRARRIYAPRIDDETAEWFLIHHVQHEVRHAPSSPMVYTGAPPTRPGDDLEYHVGFRPQGLVVYSAIVAEGTELGNPVPRERVLLNIGAGADSGSTTLQMRGTGNPTDAQFLFQLNDDAGEWASRFTAQLGSIRGSLVELLGIVDKGAGEIRFAYRIDRGTTVDRGSASIGAVSDAWTNSRLALGKAFSRVEGRALHLRHLFAELNAPDAAVDGTAMAELMDELADVPVTPAIAGHPQP